MVAPAAATTLGLTGLGAHPYVLLLNGLDVIKQAGGSGFGVAVESIHVTEAGPGAISSMTFTIDDPAGAVAMTDGIAVEYRASGTSDPPIFRGEVEGYAPTPAFGTGRSIDVRCVGIEAWLDRIMSLIATDSSGNFVSGTTPWHVLTGNATPGGASVPVGWSVMDPGPIGTPVLGPVNEGQRFAGVSNNATFAQLQAGTFAPFSIPAGTSLREYMNQLLARMIVPGGAAGLPAAGTWLLTIDFDGTVRFWRDYAPPNTGLRFQPEDYTTLAIADTVAGSIRAWPEHSIELDEVEHEVFVAGFDAASSGMFGDGTGLRGRRGTLTDPTLTTRALAAAAAAAYLASKTPNVRGGFDITDWNPPATIHAGSLLTIDDAQIGLSSSTPFRIYQIDKTFHGDGSQDWSVAYGGLPPSGAKLLRKLTRAVAV